jgi:hypothetical protein
MATETDDKEQPNILILCHKPLWWYKGFRKYPMNINKLLKICKVEKQNQRRKKKEEEDKKKGKCMCCSGYRNW